MWNRRRNVERARPGRLGAHAGRSRLRLLSLGRASIRNRKVEDAARARAALHPDAAAVVLDDLLTDRQADTRAFLGRAEAREGLEDPLDMIWIDPNAVVA